MMLKAALWYRNHMDFSVIPILTDGSKKAAVTWEQWQHERPSEDQIKKWWQSMPNANVGIITGKISGISVIDIDWYKLTEEEKAQYEKDLPKVHTPTAFTPRKGEHRYFEYNPILPTRGGILKAVDIKNDGGYVIAPPSKNGNGDYCWYERAKITDTNFHAVPHSYLNSLHLIKADNIDDEVSQQKTTRTTFDNRINFNEGTRDETIFHIANCLAKGGMPQEEIESVLSVIASKACNPPFPEKEIQSKIKSALQRSERKERNLTAEVREFIGQHSGNITTTTLAFGLQMTTREDQKKFWIILSRLAKEGLLEKTGRQAGEYRIVQKEFDSIKASDIKIERGIDLVLPFMLEQYVEILPKDLIVVAGTPNSGKTALLLDMVARNQDKWGCWYFSTEMGQQACARRLAMRDPSVKWNFTFCQDFKEFEDVIKPDDLNFIDYVEQNEGEAFKIPGILAKIQRKLRKGVAVVALQKNSGKGWAVGGEQTRAKPTLFLSVEQQFPGQLIKIEKAKAFKDFNPNGFCMKFKIVKGINLVPQNDWSPEIA